MLSEEEKINKAPAFLFYSSDFLTGCVDLTMEERGQYITLMCLQHQKGRLQSKTVEKIFGGNVSSDVLNKFNTDEKGLLFNSRLESEINKRLKYAESRSKNRNKKKTGDRKYKKFDGIKYVNLTEQEYEKLCKKYTKEKTLKAIEVLDVWLIKGSPVAKGYRNKPHYAHFRKDSWAWEKVNKAKQEERSPYRVL